MGNNDIVFEYEFEPLEQGGYFFAQISQNITENHRKMKKTEKNIRAPS
ncbi:hypothetical protein FACS1894199_04660 [Bacteroidia bacterium]|nr:hypothetical protein FACS1894199_04660 [Bacteroidia bacterium]